MAVGKNNHRNYPKPKPTDIQVYQKKRRFSNIGIILFGIVFIYLLIMIGGYLADTHITAYEVREGSIQKDNAYTGIVVRQEEVVYAVKSGYINYFVTEASKVGLKSNVYCISADTLDLEEPAEETDSQNPADLTTEEQSAIIQRAESFTDSYRQDAYQDVYMLKDQIQDILQNNTAHSRQDVLVSIVKEGTQGIDIYPAQKDGIIIYGIDGYEDLDVDAVTSDIIEKKDYTVDEKMNNTWVEPGDGVYKLITGSDWTIVINLEEELAKDLKDTDYIRVRFSKDNETTWANFSMKRKGQDTLGYLTFRQSMVRYAGERFMDVELILEDQSGLKIPKSSVITKDFYAIPQDYTTHGGNSNSLGVLVSTGSGNAEFTPVTVFYRDRETNEMYVDPGQFKEGTTLIKPDSAETLLLAEKHPLQGVYNINKGYSVFRHVNILTENEEYYIVSSGSDYSLSNYDRIALDASQVKENEIVF